MTKKTRTFLFLIVSFFFVLGAVSAVFYAQGYRFDFNNFKYLKTGGIFVKVSPSNAKVFLDGKLIGRTQFINDYLFSQSLLPKEYSLLIEKEGYSSWSKTFQVKETEVIEAKNIILFPKEIFFSQIKAKVDNFYPVDGEKIIVQKLIEPGQPEEFSIYDPEKEEGARLEKINLFLSEHDFLDLRIINSRYLLFLLQNKETEEEKYFFADLKEEDPSMQKLDFLSKEAKNIFLAESFGGSILFWQDGPLLLKKSLDNNGFPILFTNYEIKAFTLANNYFYLLSDKGELLKIDQNQSFPAQNLIKEPFDFKDDSYYELAVFGEKIFLKEDESLYALDENEKNFKKIFGGIKKIKASPFGDKLLCQMQNEFEIYLLEDIDTPFLKKAGGKIFISRFSQPIQSSDWIENDYFVFANENKIILSEIDTRSDLNTYQIGEFNDPKIWFCPKNKKIYILSNGSIFASDKIL